MCTKACELHTEEKHQSDTYVMYSSRFPSWIIACVGKDSTAYCNSISWIGEVQRYCCYLLSLWLRGRKVPLLTHQNTNASLKRMLFSLIIHHRVITDSELLYDTPTFHHPIKSCVSLSECDDEIRVRKDTSLHDQPRPVVHYLFHLLRILHPSDSHAGVVWTHIQSGKISHSQNSSKTWEKEGEMFDCVACAF